MNNKDVTPYDCTDEVYDEEFYYDDVDLAPLYAEMSRCS